jgi:hypothetical protein
LLVARDWIRMMRHYKLVTEAITTTDCMADSVFVGQSVCWLVGRTDWNIKQLLEI